MNLHHPDISNFCYTCHRQFNSACNQTIFFLSSFQTHVWVFIHFSAQKNSLTESIAQNPFSFSLQFSHIPTTFAHFHKKFSQICNPRSDIKNLMFLFTFKRIKKIPEIVFSTEVWKKNVCDIFKPQVVVKISLLFIFTIWDSKLSPFSANSQEIDVVKHVWDFISPICLPSSWRNYFW